MVSSNTEGLSQFHHIWDNEVLKIESPMLKLFEVIGLPEGGASSPWLLLILYGTIALSHSYWCGVICGWAPL